ncbi:DUF1275 family protein [Williamsia sp. 1138]|nr:DUF1275 family protein [Williamsia sp. 1138]
MATSLDRARPATRNRTCRYPRTYPRGRPSRSRFDGVARWVLISFRPTISVESGPVQSTSSTLRFALLITLASGFLDSYTFLVRGGVFANVQTANVILMGIGLSDRHWSAALLHLWPILAFLLGVTLAVHIKSGRVDHLLNHPIRWTVGFQALVLAAVGFVPTSVPHTYVTVPIAFCTAMTITMFRSIGDLGYFAVATTGNLMHMIEYGYAASIDKRAEALSAFSTYAKVAGTFAAGALIGAVATQLFDAHAVWLAAGLLAVTLVFFVVDQRRAEHEADSP